MQTLIMNKGLSVCKHCLSNGKCIRLDYNHQTFLNKHFRNVLIVAAGTPIATGMTCGVVAGDPMVLLFGVAGGYVGIMAVELWAAYDDLNREKRRRDCTVIKKD
jgi:hypothetical protein